MDTQLREPGEPGMGHGYPGLRPTGPLLYRRGHAHLGSISTVEELGHRRRADRLQLGDFLSPSHAGTFGR